MPESPPPQLGDYTLLEVLHETEDTQTLVARQRSIDRTVALVLLKPHRCGDASAVEAFRADIKAKARVTHPRIAVVYESGERDGVFFYTREMVAGRDIVALWAEGQRFPLAFVWDLLKTVCDTFLYYENNRMGYRAFQPEALVLIQEEPYLANLATAEPSEPDVFAQSLGAIREPFWRLLRASDTHIENVRQFFARMDPEHPDVFGDWRELRRACNIARQVTSMSQAPQTHEVGSLLETSEAGPGDLSMAAGRSTRMIPAVTLVVLLLLGTVLALWWLQWRRPVVPVDNPMVRVPAGEFVYHEKERIDLPEFWISKYEITIGQYAEFLTAVETSSAFDHEDQPATKRGHRPRDWRSYYAAARARGVYRGHRLTINCPVVGVDWWDAFACARWRGGRLPSAVEWEKAARGVEGFLYPWGSEPDPGKANTGLDYDKEPGAGGKHDGFNAWADVDQLGEDESPFGIVGMGGNVSEWTATFSVDPNHPDQKTPIVKGASFVSREQLDLTRGRLPPADKPSMSRGFRIAADEVR